MVMLARTHHADLAMIDPNTEDLDGLDYIPEVVEGRLASSILIVTQRADERTLVVLRRLAIAAWIDARSEELADIRCALDLPSAGRRYMSPSITRDWMGIRNSTTERWLSPREQMIFSLLGSGIDNHQAALAGFEFRPRPSALIAGISWESSACGAGAS